MLDPRDRKSWQGLFDAFHAPAGYRLSAALGTSFGLSLDALVAALLAMGEADPETLATEPVAGVMAATRLRSRVRVLLHPGTISGSSHPGSSQFVALLDRMIIQIAPPSGLFHPKVWAVRFDKVGHGRQAEPESRGRIVVSSRNLGPSTSFELATILDGRPITQGEEASPVSGDVANALTDWLKAAQATVPPDVRQLPAFVRSLVFETAHAARSDLRLRWQGFGRGALLAALPRRLKRVLVVSPFVQPQFVASLVERTTELQLVSTREALDALDDATVASMETLAPARGTPALYHITDLRDPDDPDGGYIDGVHAKLVIAEQHDGKTTTFVGSANATGPGWGVAAPANVEAMIEMRPGIDIDAFTAAFIRESKTKVHPWIAEYDRSSKADTDPERETELNLLRGLRQAAALDLALSYEAATQRLRLSVGSPGYTKWMLEPGCEYAVAPLLLTERQGIWSSLPDLVSDARDFDDVPLEKVTSFVAIRARSDNPPMERTRLALARLRLCEDELDQRDEAVRREIMATADPRAVMNALVKGLAYLPIGSEIERNAQRRSGHTGLSRILADATLERLLQAVAVQPDLVADMRLLLGSIDGSLRRLFDDLEQVVRQVRAEAQP